MQLLQKTIEGHKPGQHLLITGGVHGDEFEPMAAIRRLMQEIDPRKLSGRVTLVPCVNEPAFRRGHRCGDDGQDLARTCPGKETGTVTEQIAFALTKLIRSADMYIDLHTGGTRLAVLPLSGYCMHAIPQILEQQRRMSRAFGLPIIWGTDPNLEGRSLSIARDANVPAIYTEYMGGARLEPAGIASYVHGCLNVMAEFGLLPGPAVAPIKPPLVVEDIRPNSGHMQLNHPTPCEGFFEPAVQLGDWVKQGDVIGTVVDYLGERKEVVHAQYGGLVIVLHTFARIDPGVSVAVIMEASR